MSRWIRHPILFVALVILWLLLSQSVTPGQVLLGAAVALLGCIAFSALSSETAVIRSVRPVLPLAAAVFVDIVRSNIAVANIILSKREDRVSAFVRLPLDMTDRHGLTILACIITATPGTCWAQFSASSNTLLVHVLDLVDETEWIALIKRRYERPLMEIFE